MDEPTGRRTIQVRRNIIGAPAPRPPTVQRKSPSEYPRVSRAHLEAAKLLSSPLLLGPPLCDELVAFVEHLLTEEEARVFACLSGVKGTSAAEVARAASLPREEAARLLDHLAFSKFVITASGSESARTYRLMPIMPGIFEMALIGQKPETMSVWHRRFAELFEALYETGYAAAGGAGGRGSSFIRFLPVRDAVAGQPMALPSDRLEVVLDRFNDFGIGQCQCRMTTEIVGQGCGRPIGNCLVIGESAVGGVRDGRLRAVTKKEALEIKAEAESHGMVSWIMNVESSKSQACCSCCGCCCHAMRGVSEFNAPAIFAPPHFLPKFDRGRCTYCGACARSCPMGALVVESKRKTAWQLAQRCIGCGLCSLACDKAKAIAMEPVPDYRLPPGSWYALIARNAPSMVRSTVRSYLDRSPVSTWWRG